MSDSFVHLHVHTEYSFLDGLGHPADFAKRAKELGQTAIAVTDHGNVSAHKRWHDACATEGIKAILGVEAYVCDDALKKQDRRMHHITLLAKDLVGYRNLLKLVSASWQDGFYYKPRTDWDILKQYSKGVIATSGCPGGRLGYGVSREGWDQTKVVAELKRQADIFEDYFVEFSPWQYKEGVDYAGKLYTAMRKEGLQGVLTMDAHYPRPEDAKTQDIMLCIQNNCQFNDPDRMKFTQDDFCLHSGNDMAAKWHAIHGKGLPLLDEMILNTKRIADSTQLDFPRATPLSFKHKGDKKVLLRKWCEAGMKSRKLTGRKGYRERLEYEFDLVCSKDFVDYFLVVTDLIVWAKNNGILVGPARGSSCGSLMCFLLRITEIDPLIHGLMMERFIDVSRSDLPDIDIDFDAERRHEVKAYLETTYGADRVANLATFSTFKGKQCLQDIGRVFNYKIPGEVVSDCKRLIVERSSADSRHGFSVEDTFTDFEQAAEHLRNYPELGIARQLEGQIRQLGVHAAGTVISNEPIGNFAAVYVTPQKKDRVISMDYHDAVSVGLLKIDLLGLTALTAMKRAVEMIKNNHGVVIDINAVPLDDPEVYENFRRQQLHGIFQFEGEATRQVCRDVRPDKFEDLVAINALSRPGPLHSGGTSSFVARRRGKESSAPLHPLIESITSETYGITVYQEQVMQVVRVMGKFDWSGIATVRKMMSKKYGDEAFEAMRARFVEGATSQGVAEKDAGTVWENINTFGAWAFNKSHSVAYSVMAYQLMWLKTHYKPEFYAGVIGSDADKDKQRRVLKEFINSGGVLLPVCVNESGTEIGCGPKGLRLGFDAVKGLGAVASKIIEAQPYRNLIEFRRRSGLTKPKVEKLLKIGAFRELCFAHKDSQGDLFGADQAVTEDSDYRNPKEEDVAEICPLAVVGELTRKWRAWAHKSCKSKIWRISELGEIKSKTDVMIIATTNPKTGFTLKNKMGGHEFEAKAGEEGWTKEQYNFINFDADDETGDIVVRVSYKVYPRLKELLWDISPDEPILVQGMVTGVMQMLFAFNVIRLKDLKTKLETRAVLTPQEKELVTGIRP